MSDAVTIFLLTLSALFPIVDPVAGSPIFLAMTQDYSPQTRRALAWRVSLNSLVLMVGSYFVGAHVLNFLGVSVPVVQIGGGLVVVSMGWSILLEKDEAHETVRRSVTCTDALHSAFYPLTLPLTVGPGSISVAVTLGANSTRGYGFHIAIIFAALVAMTAVERTQRLARHATSVDAPVLGVNRVRLTMGTRSRPSTHIARTTRNSALPLSIRA